MDRNAELLESCRGQNARLIEDNKQLRAELAAVRAERDALRIPLQKASLAIAHAEGQSPGLYTEYYEAVSAALEGKP